MQKTLKALILLVTAVFLCLDIVLCVGLLKYGWQSDIVDVEITERGFEPIPVEVETMAWMKLIAYTGFHIPVGFLAWKLWRRKPPGQPA